MKIIVNVKLNYFLQKKLHTDELTPILDLHKIRQKVQKMVLFILNHLWDDFTTIINNSWLDIFQI